MSDIKLLNGDCYKLIKDIPDKSIDLVYIDIPYLSKNMAKGSGNIKNKLSTMGTQTRVETFLKIGELMDGIDYSIFDELCRIMKKTYIYIWCSKEQILDIMKYFVEEKKCLFEILVWCKTNPTPFTKNTYLPDMEYCLMFREKGTGLNDGIELKSKYFIGKTNVVDKELFKHPTIKPLELVKRHILHSSNEGDTILDCFMGSGTTGVACKELNRNFIGMEIDKEYYDIAVKRINGITANGQLSIFTDTDKLEQGSLF